MSQHRHFWQTRQNIEGIVETRLSFWRRRTPWFGGVGILFLLVLFALSPLVANATEAWSNWQRIPGPVSTANSPAGAIYTETVGTVFKSTEEVPFVFTRQSNGTIDFSFEENTWAAASPVPGGGITPSAPTAIQYGSTLDLFVRGENNTVWWNTLNGTTWSGWFQVMGPSGPLSTVSTPAVTVYQNSLYLFARQADNTLEMATFGGSFWSALSPVPGGGETFSAPSAVVYGSTLDLFVQGEDNNVWWNTLNTTTWSGWSQVSGPSGVLTTASTPSEAIHDNTLYLLTQQGDDSIQLATFGGSSWSAFSPVPSGGVTPSAPSAVDNGTLFVFVQGSDNTVWLNVLAQVINLQ